MKARMADFDAALRNIGRQDSKIADDYVCENPWRNLGIAADWAFDWPQTALN